MLSALIPSIHSYPAVHLVAKPVDQRYVQPSPLVLRSTPLKYFTPAADRDRPVSRNIFFIAITGGLDYTTIPRHFEKWCWMIDVSARHNCRTPALTSQVSKGSMHETCKSHSINHARLPSVLSLQSRSRSNKDSTDMSRFSRFTIHRTNDGL